MTRILKPQKGPQEAFLRTKADIAIYGGAAGGGKTYALLLESARNIANPRFGAVIFRRQSVQITQEGGLWDSSFEVYGGLRGALPKRSPRLYWRFPSGARIGFSHIDGDRDLMNWQGSQISLIGYDELTHFSKHQFFYMLSRNRTSCGVKPYVRATCNPDADSWVAEFIAWWIDPDTGYPILDRSGVVRYMVRIEDEIVWADERETLIQAGTPAEDIKSVTFIASTIQDNKILLEKDPSYLANLKALPLVERERLLNGNWKIKPAAGAYFKRTQVGELLPKLPKDVTAWVRGWDLAATSEDEKGDPAYTAGVLIGKRKNGRYVVADVINKRCAASDVRKLVKITCQADKAKYSRVVERFPQDPGQAGKEQAQSYVKMLAGFLVKTVPESGSKESRAEPFAAQWQAGNVDVLVADWNEIYFNQMESFPESKFKDMVDASSSGFNEIESQIVHSAPPENQNLGKSSYWKR